MAIVMASAISFNSVKFEKVIDNTLTVHNEPGPGDDGPIPPPKPPCPYCP